MTGRSRYALGLLAIVSVALLLFQTPLLTSVRGHAWSLWVGTIGRWFSVGPLTVSDNVAEQLAALTAENVRLKAAAADLQRLREQLGAPSYEDFAAIPAEVAARPLDPFQAQFVVNRGAAEGVTIGAPAVITGSTLVGFISELDEHTATLQLLFHPATNVPVEVMVDGQTGRGLLRGKAFTAVMITSVPRDIALQVGQDVITSSEPTIIPPGLLVGQIMAFEDEIHEPFQQARIRVPYDPDSLYAVSILVAR